MNLLDEREGRYRQLFQKSPMENKNIEDHVSRDEFKDRRQDQNERRKIPSDGFAYMSTVGWICRREKSRRKEDSLDY